VQKSVPVKLARLLLYISISCCFDSHPRIDSVLQKYGFRYGLLENAINAVGLLDQQADRLVELNIYQQLKNLMKTNVIQKAWHEERRPILHGWVYGISDGLLKSLYKIEPGSPIDDIYRFDY
ncbi:MAG: carbonic anhydrase, partial [Pseudomonadota bacterium]